VTPGETVALFGTGFGTLRQPVQATIGEQPAQVTFCGLVAPGVYQVNVIVPNVDPKYRFFGVPVAVFIDGVGTRALGYLGF
jgi:uncharacterized protein (TIGR03437 family)